MKTLKWFHIGEPIPDSAVFIRSERKKVGTKTVEVEDWPPYGGGSSYHEEERPIYEELHLYEVKLDGGKQSEPSGGEERG